MTLIEFEIFAAQVSDALWRRATAITGDEELAADLRQDTLLRLWSMRHGLDEYQHPDALAMVIVTRLAFDHLRRVGRRSMVPIDSVADEFADNTAEHSVGADVDAILSMLPERQQLILRMRHVDGLELDEMARVLNCSNGAVRTALSRARQAALKLFSSNNI